MSKTKAAALHEFFSSFGLTAYVNTSVPDDVTFPYLTYEFISGAFNDTPASITVNLWFFTESEAIPNRKAEEISRVIGQSGKLISCDDGLIWIKRGSPFCQSLTDDTDPGIKRRYMNITLEYFTR